MQKPLAYRMRPKNIEEVVDKPTSSAQGKVIFAEWSMPKCCLR